MKKCTKCGKQVVVHENFCPDCGGTCVEEGQVTNAPVNPEAKSRMVAGLLGIFIGSLGVHRFYLGYIGIGIAQILVTIVTCGIGSLWGLIEGILILTGNGVKTDAKGNPLVD
ncbi:MAG: NINE protein [Pseudomonadales bacterium]|jgi:TM2 domain-containing membrane protein YozV|nr:NINE protein [Pseudomonadales bacterium]